MTGNHSDKCQFASDNYSGICPEAWQALEEANIGTVHSYGDDPWTATAADKIRELFETNCDVYFVFNGTAANSLALASLCQSYHSIICSDRAHIETDECGAPEFFSNGTKILLTPSDNGKILPSAMEEAITRRNDIHYPRPRVISITQTTELGTVYTVRELLEIEKIREKYDLKIHMDGARFANAVASLGLKPAEITWKCGVDVLCFGGTKNGMAIGEAVIFFNRELSKEFDYRCKQAGQLASKMRFLSAPWVRFFSTGTWMENAKKSNAYAKLLKEKLSSIKQIRILYPVEANALFVEMPEKISMGLKARGWYFYDFIGTNSARFMCSWNTSEKDVLELAKDFRELAEE